MGDVKIIRRNRKYGEYKENNELSKEEDYNDEDEYDDFEDDDGIEDEGASNSEIFKATMCIVVPLLIICFLVSVIENIGKEKNIDSEAIKHTEEKIESNKEDGQLENSSLMKDNKELIEAEEELNRIKNRFKDITNDIKMQIDDLFEFVRKNK